MQYNYSPPEPIQEPDPAAVGFNAKTPHVCSGPCCGNPRRWFGGDEKITMQERRANARDQDWEAVEHSTTWIEETDLRLEPYD